MHLLSDRPLVVWPNPFHALDHKGRPACAVRLDPDVSAGERRYIGAACKAELLRKFTDEDHPGAAVADDHAGHYDVTFDFEFAPVEVPDTGYHRDRIRDGELIPGNKSSARRSWAGGIKREFEEPIALLKRERDAASELWSQEHDGEEAPAAKIEVAAPKPKPAPSAEPSKAADEKPVDASRAARGLGPKKPASDDAGPAKPAKNDTTAPPKAPASKAEG